MKAAYFPILKAMNAELRALEHTKPAHAAVITPLFEFGRLPDRIKYRNSAAPIAEYLGDTAQEIGRVWAGRNAMFDAYHWSPTQTTEHGDHVITYAFHALKAEGIQVMPVVGYDRWSVVDYQMALRNITQAHAGSVCIRLDHSAFEDSAEPEFFSGNLQDILDSLGLHPSRCHVLLDLEDVTAFGVVDLLGEFEALFDLIAGYRFGSFSVAGCSLPKSINEAVKHQNSCGSVLRKELLLWKNARQTYPDHPIYFGDYGVRGPNSNDGTPSRNTNGKIRYTTDAAYFIARGHSLSIPPKGEQMWPLAQKIIASTHFAGSRFSWGDSEIVRCSNAEFKGNAGQWIAIDTNHHLAYVVTEVAEFERAIAANTVVVEQ